MLYTTPNSHFYTDLEQLLYAIAIDIHWHGRKAENPTIDLYEPLTPKHIIIGLENSIKHKYVLKNDKNEVISINSIINYITSKEYSLDGLRIELEDYVRRKFNLNKKNMERKEVYKHLDVEREYQEKKWNVPQSKDANFVPDSEKPVAEWINYIEYHISVAKTKVYHLDYEGALAEIRKATALGVSALEIHGCPERIK